MNDKESSNIEAAFTNQKKKKKARQDKKKRKDLLVIRESDEKIGIISLCNK